MNSCILHRASCRQTLFVRSDLTYADFSHANLEAADLSGATLFRANLHQIVDSGARFSDRARALATDPELAAAENWQPPF